MHLFITGIGGFIGKRAAELALEKGWEVSGMEASAQKALEAEKLLKVKVFQGDVSKAEDCNRALTKADIVLHTAAIVQEDGDWELFRMVNVEGTLNVARAAKRAGVKQFIHLSSVMVYGFHYVPYITEDGLVSGDQNPYCQTKIESEINLKRLKEDDFAITIIRPGDVYGPGSVPWVIRPLEMMKAWQFMHIDGGKGYFNYVYVDNLLDAIFLAMQPKAYNETFTVTDGAVTNKTYFTKLAQLGGYKWLPDVPAFLLKPVAGLLGGVMQALNRPLQVNEQAIRYMQRPHPYSNEKVKKVLGYHSAVSLEEGLNRTEAWLHQYRPDLLAGNG